MAYSCDLCGKKFDMKKNLDYHTKNKVCNGKDFKCKYCENKFTSSSSMYRHMSKLCKEKQRLQREEEKIIKENEEKDNILQTILNELKEIRQENKQLKDIVDKLQTTNSSNGADLSNTTNAAKAAKASNAAKSSNTAKSSNAADSSNAANSSNIANVAIDNSISNSNIINNTNNGIVVNNTYNLVGYGKEDLSKIDKDDFLKVLQIGGFDTALKLTEMIHFNPKYPEYHNIYIPSTKDKNATVFDGTLWCSKDKTEFVAKVYDDKKNYIEEIVDEYMNKLSTSRKDAFKRWLDTDETDPRILKIKEDIKRLMYDRREYALAAKKALKQQITQK